MFKLKLDSKKALEAAVILARHSPRRMISRKRLLALLYMANRECLKRSGRPIVGGRVVAMKYGPIHGDVYNLLIGDKERAEGTAEWSEHFHNDGFYVVLHDEPAISTLSRFEIETLKNVLEAYEDEDDWDVARHTHAFLEYKIAYRPNQSRTIPFEQILNAVGLSRRRESILRDLKEKEEIDDLFAGAEKKGRSKN
ncbi:MAG TPA: Panacea domain-containing protein [Gemmataceae bacterium]|nr:Panacea domain-containing protein [Gemmataceae bacterium]